MNICRKLKLKAYKKFKEKLKRIDFVNSLLRFYGEEERKWQRFYDFKCDSFFVGSTLEKLNKEVYEKNINKIWRKIAILERIKERIKENEE
jgi:hypothetical protein